MKTSARSQEDSADKLSQMIEECLKDCSLSRKLKDLEDGLASLQRKTQSTAKLITPLDRKFEELESVVASQKTLLASQSKSLEVMQREINDLQIHIPRKPAPQKIESSQSLERLQNLESQVTSLGQALQRMSEKETQPPLVEPHAAKVEMPQPAAPATSINNGALNEWNEVSWKPAAEASSSDAASRRRSSSMPKYTAPKPKRGFEFQRPLKPTDTSMRDVCLEVERQLCEAMFGEAPVDVRKKVLKTVQLRPESVGRRESRHQCHSDCSLSSELRKKPIVRNGRILRHLVRLQNRGRRICPVDWRFLALVLYFAGAIPTSWATEVVRMWKH